MKDESLMMSQLNWNLLRTFMVIVQEGSITKAASRLGLSQPAVSHALKSLEMTVGLKLINRDKSGRFETTSAGQNVYKTCFKIYHEVEGLNAFMIPEELHGNVCVYMSNYLYYPQLFQYLSDFQKDYPMVQLQIVRTICAEVYHAIIQKKSVIGFSSFFYNRPSLEQFQILEIPYHYYCSSKHPLYQTKQPDADSLAKANVIVYQTNEYFTPLKSFSQYRLNNNIGSSTQLRVTGLVDMVEAIAHGFHIGLLPDEYVQQYVPDFYQIPMPLEDLPQLPFYMALDSRTPLAEPEKTLVDFLRSKFDC